MRKTLAQRFWEKVHRTKTCWLWTASLGTHGYGQIGDGKAVKAAYRVAWELTHGPIPPGLCVCHHCDNPPCVNPSHLFLATQRDNLRDMRMKGRGQFPPPAPCGERNNRARLTSTQVAEIRQRYAAGESLRTLGAHYRVWHTTISDVVNRKTWSQ